MSNVGDFRKLHTWIRAVLGRHHDRTLETCSSKKSAEGLVQEVVTFVSFAFSFKIPQDAFSPFGFGIMGIDSRLVIVGYKKY